MCILFFRGTSIAFLYERFLEECHLSIPDVLLLNANRLNGDPTDIVDDIQSHADEYSKLKQRIRNEEFGKTAKFRLCLYLDVMRFQHFAHLSVQENNFEMKLICWEFFLPFYFALNKTITTLGMATIILDFFKTLRKYIQD